MVLNPKVEVEVEVIELEKRELGESTADHRLRQILFYVRRISEDMRAQRRKMPVALRVVFGAPVPKSNLGE